MNYYKHIVNKNLGQNFLVDLNIVNKIIKVMSPKKNDVMVEIGPGLGALTCPICQILDKLVVIEYDKNLAVRLKNQLDNLKVFVNDVLKFDFLNFLNKINKSVRIFGNLPYNISIKLLCYLFQFNAQIVDMHFMFQKEVANRLLACPGTKNYGRLSIIVQYYYEIYWLFNVLPESFDPVPKVHSTFLKFKPRKHLLYYAKNLNKLQLITKIAFRHRRKMIKHSLSSLFNEEVFKELNIDSMVRAENLSIKQYCQLSNYIS